jgi:hypothetical protein
MNSNIHPAHQPHFVSPDPANAGRTDQPPLSNPRHEAFAQAVASGLSATDAYVTVYSQRRRDSAAHIGCRLRKNPAVAARIAGLRSAAARQVTIDLQKILAFRERVITTPIGEVTASSDLCHR